MKKPSHMPEYAEICLQAVVDYQLADRISVGGALGLLHHIDYRSTRDVDAWWTDAAQEGDQERVIRVISDALAPSGDLAVRRWGDVVSIELERDGRAVFSFQIARRSAQLAPSLPAPWGGFFIDSLPDLIGSKMVALVERGAPRDFRDIYTLCKQGLSNPPECWRLWRARQEKSESDTDEARARLAIETHLVRIAQHRPLETIEDEQQKAQAEGLRRWYREEFLVAHE